MTKSSSNSATSTSLGKSYALLVERKEDHDNLFEIPIALSLQRMMCMSSIPRPGLSPKIPRLAHMLLTLLSKCNSAALKSPPLKPSRSTLSTRELPPTPSIHFILSPPPYQCCTCISIICKYTHRHHSITHTKTHIEWAIKEKNASANVYFN